MIRRTHLKSAGKLEYTQYQEYDTLGMDRRTLAVRILAVVSNHAVIPPQVCMLLHREKAVYCNVYHKMYAVIQQILGRMEIKRQSNKSIFGHYVLTDHQCNDWTCNSQTVYSFLYVQVHGCSLVVTRPIASASLIVFLCTSILTFQPMILFFKQALLLVTAR